MYVCTTLKLLIYMKRLPLLTIIVVVSLLFLYGCEKEYNDNKGPKIETLSAEKGPLFVVSLAGRVSGLEGVALDFECGIEYSSDASFTEVKTVRQKVDKKYSEDPFTVTITRVNPEQKYYYRAYYISQSMIYYGEVKDFTFIWDVPQVTTLSAEWIDLNKAKLYGSINGLGDILEHYSRSNVYYGIQYSTSENFDASFSSIESDYSTNNIYFANKGQNQISDTIECNLSYFRYNTKYYYRTFFFFYFGNVISDNMLSLIDGKSEIYFGAVKDFTFTWDAPQVTTLSDELSSDNIGRDIVVCKGLIDGLGDIVKNYSDSTLRYGIQYSTSESFDTDTTGLLYANNYNSQLGDTVICQLYNYYNTKFYYRAFFYYRGIFEVGETKHFKYNSRENGTENGYQYIELGLSVKWATSNVGATKPWDYGGHYAWGETETKNNYSASTYKWCDTSVFPAHNTKYNTDSSSGIVDNKTTLDPEDDVAHVKWGGSWRMPTAAEQDELLNNCTWVWYESGNSEFGGVAGYKVTSKKLGYTDRFIFLPATGYIHENTLYRAGDAGYYWSSTLYTSNSGYAQSFLFGSSTRSDYTMSRENGYAVRPVCP